MASFSQRSGLKPLEKPLQVGLMDADLRNQLWSALEMTVLSQWIALRYGQVQYAPASVKQFLETVWTSFLKLPLDLAGIDGGMKRIRKFFFECPWNEVYDFIEFTLTHAGQWQSMLFTKYNAILEIENAGYRILGQNVTPITNVAEMEVVS